MQGLNDRQSEACCHTNGPLLILAGAGSGKTRVITHRIAYLIDEMSVNPYNILAITFTNKAAKEMRERVDRLVGYGAESVWVSTFHSMCVRILRKHIERIGGDRNFTIYDADEQRVVVREAIKYLDMDIKLYPERMVLAVISKAKEQYMSPDDYEREHAASFRDQQIARIYREYQRRLMSNHALDFDDLIYRTIFLFETNPDVLAEYQERFKYIMVDEYQDTNYTQFVLVKMLAAKYKNLCVVGDDDQSIYKFRGADITNILNFEQVYPDAKVVKLEQNYRSTANILNAANGVIAHNAGRKDKTLWTAQDAGEKVLFTEYATEHEEANGIASGIKSLKHQGVSLDDIAILYRTNAQSRVIEEKLIYENLPYNVFGGQSFYGRKEVRDMLAYLRVLANSSDDQSVQRIINVPKRGIGAASVEKISAFAIENGMNFYDALLDIEQVPAASRAADKIRRFTALMEGFRDMLGEGSFISEVYDAVLEKTGYLTELMAEGTDEAKTRIENLEELKNKIVKYEEESENPNLTELMEQIALVADADENEDDGNAPAEKLTLMTMHRAKGLEFPYVFICGMEERLFPSGLSLDSDDADALEEERRLCYVGITRAMQRLYLSAARQRMINGQTNFCEVSRFVDEIPADYLERDRSKTAGFGVGSSSNDSAKGRAGISAFGSARFTNMGYGRPKMAAHDYAKTNPYTGATAVNPSANPGFGKAFPMGDAAKSDYAVGDHVKHLKFGKGVVVSVVPAGSDQEVTVDFERVGEKTMFASLVKMKKL